MKIILLIILGILFYAVGEITGEEKSLKLIKQCLEQSKDWNEFLENFSIIYKNVIGD